MKVISAVLLAALCLANALPSQDATKDSRFIGDIIVGIIEQLVQNVPDPWMQEKVNLDIGLPVPILFNVNARADAAVAAGLSNIIVNRMDTSGIANFRLDMDIYLPRIALALADAGVDVTVLGSHAGLSADANLVISEPRIAGSIQFNVGIITGVFVREVNLQFTLGGLQFDGRVEAMGIDVSDEIRQLVNVMIPQRLKELENDINELVNIVAMDIFSRIL